MTTLRPRSIATFGAHGLAHAPHLMRHFRCFCPAKAENEALANIGAGISGGKGPQPKTLLRGAGRYLLVRHSRRKRDYQMHTGFRAQDFHLGAFYFFAEFLPQASASAFRRSAYNWRVLRTCRVK